MAEDDIYGSKAKYEAFKKNLCWLVLQPKERWHRKGTGGKYVCRNTDNLQHFKRLLAHFEAKDLSYIRRIRVLQSMRFTCHATGKNLVGCGREDIDEIMALAHATYRTPVSKQTFIKDIKYIWKTLFPETDDKGRADETIVPYPVRHLSAKSDRSREKLRKDKLAWSEFEQVVNYFSNDPRMQAYLTLSVESLTRPQELLYVKIGDVELYDNYAKIYLSEHGKEGVGLLQCIDSYPYLLKWLNVHPLKKDPKAFLFVNVGDTNRCRQLRPQNINKLIRKACKDLGIDKPITCYSLKRNGVTMRRLRGDSDMEIQHAARWTSTKQLKTYDLSSQEEAFRRELEKRGFIPASNGQALRTLRCEFCNKAAGFGEIICQQCKRPLERDKIRVEMKQKDEELEQLKDNVAVLGSQLARIKQEVLTELAQEILQLKPDGVEKSALRQQVALPRLRNGRAVVFSTKDSEGSL